MDRIPVALPPVAEQQRIATKVDELMALCDRLEASLAAADHARSRLLDTLLHEALASTDLRVG
jgi:type I restriction enzyme, S subunit